MFWYYNEFAKKLMQIPSEEAAIRHAKSSHNIIFMADLVVAEDW